MKAEVMFLKALRCESDVVAKAMSNLGLLYNTRGNYLAQTGDMNGAQKAANDAVRYLEEGKARLDALMSDGKLDSQLQEYASRYRPLRLQSHKLIGQLHAGAGDMVACEAEFRQATESFPDDAFAWQALSRALEMQGKVDEAKQAVEKAQLLR